MIRILLFSVFMCAFFTSSAQGFLDVTTSAGITFQHDGEDPTIVDHYDVGTGVAWLDYNKDGWLDLYLTKRRAPNELYKNNGDGTFTEVAGMMGVADSTGDGSGVSIADFNNDGWEDIFLANNMADRLFKNVNGTHFQDITATSGLGVSGNSKGMTAAWGDYDQDGFLDLYVANYRKMQDTMSNATTQDFLFHNNGDETFTDVSNLLGFNDLMGFGFIGSWTDFDNDGDLDIILVNDCFPGSASTRTKVFRNDGGVNPLNWNFSEASAVSGINDCRNGMGLAIGDYNHDGWMDVFYSDIGPTVLFKNENGKFKDVTASANVGTQDTSNYSWGTNFMDVDMDGWLDLILMSGTLQGNSLTEPRRNFLFLNDGNGTSFSDYSNPMGMNDPGKARSSAYADYDNDGDLDLFIVNYGETGKLMENINFNGYNHVRFNLNGTVSNADGIGARIQITTPDGMTQYYETRSGSSSGCGDMIDAFFGLDTNTVISFVEINWPSGMVQSGTNLAVNQTYIVTESNISVSTNPINIENKTTLNIQPNPIIGTDFQIVVETISKEFSIQIYNTLGQQVYQSSQQANPFDKTVVSLPSDVLPDNGVYLVAIQDGNNTVTKQVIIIR